MLIHLGKYTVLSLSLSLSLWSSSVETLIFPTDENDFCFGIKPILRVTIYYYNVLSSALCVCVWLCVHRYTKRHLRNVMFFYYTSNISRAHNSHTLTYSPISNAFDSSLIVRLPLQSIHNQIYIRCRCRMNLFLYWLLCETHTEADEIDEEI